MLDAQGMQRLLTISDTVLYPEAVALLRRLLKEQQCDPLPNAQINGLLHIAGTSSFAQIDQFVKHQRDRNWPERQQYIPIFYKELERYLVNMRTQRLTKEFRLLSPELSIAEERRQAEEVMALLVREFVQHLAAENMLQESLRKNANPVPRQR